MQCGLSVLGRFVWLLPVLLLLVVVIPDSIWKTLLSGILRLLVSHV
jgi:hypothetical protein